MFTEVPEVRIFGAEDTFAAGEDASLTCNVKGDTPMNITWTMDGQGISPGLGVSIIPAGPKTSIIMIGHVSYKHSADFSCVASNIVGVDQQTVGLVVEGQLLMHQRKSHV